MVFSSLLLVELLSEIDHLGVVQRDGLSAFNFTPRPHFKAIEIAEIDEDILIVAIDPIVSPEPIGAAGKASIGYHANGIPALELA